MQRLTVRVRPQSGRSELVPPAPGEEHWQAFLKSPPVDGKANEELLALVARHFGCPKRQVSLRTGASGRIKRVDVDAS